MSRKEADLLVAQLSKLAPDECGLQETKIESWATIARDIVVLEHVLKIPIIQSLDFGSFLLGYLSKNPTISCGLSSRF
jgi:hypothetical protein